MRFVDSQTRLDQEYSIFLCAAILGQVLVEPQEQLARALNSQSYFLPPGFHSAVEQDEWKEWIV